MINGKYDLADRTFKFSQLVRAGTSIGANYAEADSAPTKKDFLNKLSISHKEINETKYWLKIIAGVIEENKKDPLRKLYKEVQELNLIFATIIRKTKHNLEANH